MTRKPYGILLFLMLALGAGPVQAEEITVSAAASLGNAFTDIARAYEAQYPGSKVHLNTASSGALLQQITHGAPVDVLATADEVTLDQAADRGLLAAGTRQVFIANTLVVVVPKDSAGAPRQLQQLSAATVKRIALGNPESVPVGRYARDALQAAGLWPSLSSRMIHTQNVRQSLDYVARGEVDAGFVYGSDASTFKDRVTQAFSVATTTPIHYPIAQVAGSRQPQEAARFIAFVRSPRGVGILRGYGFVAPAPVARGH